MPCILATHSSYTVGTLDCGLSHSSSSAALGHRTICPRPIPSPRTWLMSIRETDSAIHPTPGSDATRAQYKLVRCKAFHDRELR